MSDREEVERTTPPTTPTNATTAPHAEHDEGGEEEDVVLPPSKGCNERSWDHAKEATTAVAAAATVGTSVASALLGLGGETTSAVLLSTGGAAALGTTVASCAAIQQRQVSQVNALQRDVGKLKEDLNRRREENRALLNRVQDQEGSLSHSQDMEDALEIIRHTEGQSLNELDRQLQGSRQVLGEISMNHRAMILQHLTAFLLEHENDDKDDYDQDALDRLLGRVEAEHPISVNRDAVQPVLERYREEGTVAVVMEMIQNLLSEDDLHPRQVIFQFE